MEYFYIPKTKKDLISWIIKTSGNNNKLIKMDKKQLYAIFYSIRSRCDKKGTNNESR